MSVDYTSFWLGFTAGLFSVFALTVFLALARHWQYLHSLSGIANLVSKAKEHGG